MTQLKSIESYPAILTQLFATRPLAAGKVVHLIHMRIMTALRLRIPDKPATAVQASHRRTPIGASDLESSPMRTIQDCVSRWSLTGREYDLEAGGDRLIGLRLRLSGLETGAVRS